MTKYVKRPVPVEAIQWTGYNLDAVAAFCNGNNRTRAVIASGGDDAGKLRIYAARAREWITVEVNDWVIREPFGPEAFYPCAASDFALSYQEVAE